LPDSSKQYPLTIERVRKIRSLNAKNIIPDELEPVEVTSTKPKEVEPEFVDVVGHITLKSLEKTDRKKVHKQVGPPQKQMNQQRQGQQQRQGNNPPPQKGKPQGGRPTPPQKGGKPNNNSNNDRPPFNKKK
jgi:hypothetical protein